MLKPTLLIVLALAVITGCSNMEEQPKLDEPYQASDSFGRAARDILPEAVPVGFERDDEHFWEGTVDGELVDELPFELTEEVLMQGQKRYNEFCYVCHGLDGGGEGVIALEGYPQPASYHTDEIRNMSLGHYYQVITNGQGVMWAYGSRIEASDRWAIAAYIRALQLSQNASVSILPEEAQTELTSLGQEGE